jgi:hypothetical protein
MVCLLPAEEVRADGLPPNVVSWWPGEDDATDIMGVNDGVEVNGIGYVSGKVGLAFSFDGMNDYVRVNDSASLDVATGHTFTLWLKIASFPSSEDYVLMDKWASAFEDKLLAIHHADRKVVYYLFDTFGGSGLESTTALEPNVWYHIAATYNGSTANIYINGQLDATKTASGDVADSSGNLYFGYNPDRAYEGWFAYFRGQLDEIGWFDRALSSSEIETIYKAGMVPVGGTAYPINKLAVLAPWIVLFVAIIAGASLLVLRRRRA